MNCPEINRFKYKGRLSPQQSKTLRGQALSDDVAGEKKGLERTLKKAGAGWKSKEYISIN